MGISAPHLLAFALVAVVVIAIPGPSVLFIVSRAITSGRRVAVLSVLGNSAGVYAQAVAVAFGMGVLAEQSLALFFAMKLAGGAYLIYLGIKTFRERGPLAALWEAPTEGWRIGRHSCRRPWWAYPTPRPSCFWPPFSPGLHPPRLAACRCKSCSWA